MIDYDAGDVSYDGDATLYDGGEVPAAPTAPPGVAGGGPEDRGGRAGRGGGAMALQRRRADLAVALLLALEE